jgi:hypothetical protein
MRPILNAYQFTYNWTWAESPPAHILIFAGHISKAAEEAPDVKGRQLVLLFHHTSTGRFLLLPSESGKFDNSCLPHTPRVTPAAIGNQEEQHS